MSSSNGVLAKSLSLSFPEEILEQICEEVASFEEDSTSTLSAWVCTCRTFVSSGERVLYRSPFRSFSSHFYLSHTAFSAPYKPGLTSPLSLGIHRYDQHRQDAPDLGRLVSHKVKNLLLQSSITYDWQATAAFLDFLSQYEARRGQPAVFAAIRLSVKVTATEDNYRKPYEASRVRVDVGYGKALYAVGFLPVKLSCLNSLSITMDAPTEPVDVDQFFRFLREVEGLRLTSFAYVTDFNYDREGVVFPDFAFSLFPHARRLTLTSGVDMNMDALETLVRCSPDLEHLNLDCTIWSLPSSASPDSPSLQTQVLDTLARLPRLRRANLGFSVNPYLDNEPGPGVGFNESNEEVDEDSGEPEGRSEIDGAAGRDEIEVVWQRIGTLAETTWEEKDEFEV
ncbi:hypothetical protein JCM8097_006698 [Rhodosporidiobolus ruineniae]